MVRAVYATVTHQNLEGWNQFFNGKNGEKNYTVEADIVSVRSVLTSDPENIKAILGEYH